jgi:hypothetical protein
VPEEKLRDGHSMGAEEMRITIVGAVLIVAALTVVVLVVRARKNNADGGPLHDQSQQYEYGKQAPLLVASPGHGFLFRPVDPLPLGSDCSSEIHSAVTSHVLFEAGRATRSDERK